MLDLLLWALWFIFGAYTVWFLTRAKTFQPLTLDDLALTWRLHKQLMGCKASRIHSLLTKNDVVVGFKCDCGYKFIQKRLITQRVQKHTQTSILSLKGSAKLQKIRNALNDLRYMHVKEI